MPEIIIKQGREKPILNRHPWIFSGAIARVKDSPKPGDIVTVTAHNGDFLARGYWNVKSQIQVRLLTWKDEPIDDSWWAKMLAQAIEARAPYESAYHAGQPTAHRLVNAENDYLPGLVVDRYGDWLVLQALTLGIDQRKNMIANMLAETLKPQGIYERSDVDVREKEGLQQATGTLWGKNPPEILTIQEGSVQIFVDIPGGHKTGFYLDQAANRRLLYHLFSQDAGTERHILNLFSYTGGFGLHALSASANTRVINVDSSVEALHLAETNVKHNDLPLENTEFIQANVFHYLRDIAHQGEQYDFIILDPPKFAHNKTQVSKAAHGYKDINLSAFRLVKPGGYLMTFSCSGAISQHLFQQIVFGALADTSRQAQIIQQLGPSDDHPVALTFPEGEYLKGLLLRVY